MCRYVLHECVSVAWVVASFCLQSLSIFSSRMFSSFLVYSLISYSSIFEYGRLPVECVGMFFIGVCRGLGRLLSVACGMYRYVFYRCVSGLGRLLSVACGMYRYVVYRCVSGAWEIARCVSVAWEIAVGSLWHVS